MPVVDFNRIRAHHGSQDQGFEELCFQLLPSLEPLTAGARVDRHGTPDGGAEFIATFPDGAVWAWQAKYIPSLTGSALDQIGRSVSRALATQPAMTRFTVMMPFNRPAGDTTDKNGRRRESAMTKWQKHVERWKAQAASLGRSVDFEWQGESELHSALTSPENAGRLSYWFDVHVLGEEWLERHWRKVAADVQGRYSPELHVDLPLEKAMETLTQAQRVRDELAAAVDGIREARVDPPAPDGDRQDLESSKLRVALDHAVASAAVLGQTAWPPDGSALEAIGACREALSLLGEEMGRRHQGLGDGEPRAREHALSRLRARRRAVLDLNSLMEERACELIDKPYLFIVGEPGSGKTHLLCRAAERAAKDGAPVAMLLGSWFDRSSPEQQIVAKLGLGGSWEQTLGALDAAAEARGMPGLIIIDALNEGEGIDLWPNSLMGLVSDMQRWPRLGLVVSCRSSFSDEILEPKVRAATFVTKEHEGFAGHEAEAAAKYLDHFGIRTPDFPLLNQEFRVPVFLKTMCVALAQAGITEYPRSHGATHIFGFFLDALNIVLSKAKRCDYPAEEPLVAEAAKALSDMMLETGTTWLAFSDAQALSDKLLPGRGWSHSLLHGLITEGLLMKEQPLEDQPPRVLFAYQRLGDHLMAQALCDLLATPSELSARCELMTADAADAYRTAGLLEALAVLIPERYRGAELHDMAANQMLEPVVRAYLESLVWRDPAAFSDPPSLDYVNKIATSSKWHGEAVLEALIRIACVPGHPFNARVLDGTLRLQKMPQRDRWWSAYLHEQDYPESPVMTTISWAGSRSARSSSDDVAGLCSTTLAWFLTTSNRFVRDKTTKAIASLVVGRASVCEALLERFVSVDDPYVAERVLAATYGATLRSRDRTFIAAVARATYDIVFREGEVPVHVLSRDYARGIIERADALGCAPEGCDLRKTRPPHVSPWPISAPSTETLQSRCADDAYYPLWSSLMTTMGDFRHHVAAHAIEAFEAPRAQKRRGDHIRRSGPQPYSIELGCRWMLNRVLGMGWTPERFGRFDALMARGGDGRSGHRAERIGKKYQWIALHELVARLSDHCALLPLPGDDELQYEGPWQLYLRDIDPSVTAESTTSPWDGTTVGWSSPGHPSMPPEAASELEAWSKAPPDPDLPVQQAVVQDEEGRQWLALEGHYRWAESEPHLTRAAQATVWLHIQAYILHAHDLPRFAEWAAGQNWVGGWMPEIGGFYPGFLGEYPWHPSSVGCASGPRRDRMDRCPVDVTLPTLQYSWDKESDCSVAEALVGLIPSLDATTLMSLEWTGEDCDYVVAEGAPATAVTDPGFVRDGPHVCLVDWDVFMTCLDRADLTAVWLAYGQRIVTAPYGEPGYDSPPVDYSHTVVSSKTGPVLLS